MKTKWMGKNSIPKKSMWYYTRNHDGSITSRYFEDSEKSWWISSARYGWTTNGSFVEWLYIEGLT